MVLMMRLFVVLGNRLILLLYVKLNVRVFRLENLLVRLMLVGLCLMKMVILRGIILLFRLIGNVGNGRLLLFIVVVLLLLRRLLVLMIGC